MMLKYFIIMHQLVLVVVEQRWVGSPAEKMEKVVQGRRGPGVPRTESVLGWDQKVIHDP